MPKRGSNTIIPVSCGDWKWIVGRPAIHHHLHEHLGRPLWFERERYQEMEVRSMGGHHVLTVVRGHVRRLTTIDDNWIAVNDLHRCAVSCRRDGRI